MRDLNRVEIILETKNKLYLRDRAHFETLNTHHHLDPSFEMNLTLARTLAAALESRRRKLSTAQI